MDPAGAQPARMALLPRRDPAPGLRVYEAGTPRARALGLAFLDRIPTGSALHIRPCRAVHTFGMRFALDLIWLGPGDEVVAVDPNVPCRRMRVCASARSVLETGAGDADRFLLALGRPPGKRRELAADPSPGAWR